MEAPSFLLTTRSPFLYCSLVKYFAPTLQSFPADRILTFGDFSVHQPHGESASSRAVSSLRVVQHIARLTSFRINTCKSVSKQRTLTPFRINTYEKHRGRGVVRLTSSSAFREKKTPSSGGRARGDTPAKPRQQLDARIH